MPYEFIGVSTTVVHVRWTGELTVSGYREMIDAILALESFTPRMGIVIDRREVQPPLTPFVRAITEYVVAQPRLEGCRWAIVYDGQSASLGMVRMAGILNEHLQIEAFTELDAALDWGSRLTP